MKLWRGRPVSDRSGSVQDTDDRSLRDAGVRAGIRLEGHGASRGSGRATSVGSTSRVRPLVKLTLNPAVVLRATTIPAVPRDTLVRKNPPSECRATTRSPTSSSGGRSGPGMIICTPSHQPYDRSAAALAAALPPIIFAYQAVQRKDSTLVRLPSPDSAIRRHRHSRVVEHPSTVTPTRPASAAQLPTGQRPPASARMPPLSGDVRLVSDPQPAAVALPPCDFCCGAAAEPGRDESEIAATQSRAYVAGELRRISEQRLVQSPVRLRGRSPVAGQAPGSYGSAARSRFLRSVTSPPPSELMPVLPASGAAPTPSDKPILNRSRCCGGAGLFRRSCVMQGWAHG